MAPGIVTDPSVVHFGYGCFPKLSGMTFMPIEIVLDFPFCVCIHVEYSFILKSCLPPERERDCGVTHKVRSLGMWLKLETEMPLMLLLFSVL